MKKILILAVLTLAATTVKAQTVMPLYAEGKAGKWIRGQFTVMNQGVTPLPVSVEPRQLQIIDGKGTFGMLQDAQVELKDTSATIPPRGSRVFDYKVFCKSDCMVTFLNGFITGKTKEGVLVRLILPSHVYLCTEPKGCRDRIKAAAGLP